jgi:hypothetical protein
MRGASRGSIRNLISAADARVSRVCTIMTSLYGTGTPADTRKLRWPEVFTLLPQLCHKEPQLAVRPTPLAAAMQAASYGEASPKRAWIVRAKAGDWLFAADS